MLLNLISSSCWIAAFLFVFNQNDVLPVYFKLFKLNKIKFLLVDDYFNDKEKFPLKNESYLEHLNSKYYNFLTQLISCPPCLSFWCAFLASTVVSGAFFWLSWPIIYMLSLILYFGLNFLIKNADK
jgi:hypothetical protein